MKHANSRLADAKAPVDALGDTFGIVDELRDVMTPSVADRVPSMVAYIVDEDVEALGETGPEREIGIGREPVAVAEEHCRAKGISMTPDDDRGAVRRSHLPDVQRVRDDAADPDVHFHNREVNAPPRACSGNSAFSGAREQRLRRVGAAVRSSFDSPLRPEARSSRRHDPSRQRFFSSPFVCPASACSRFASSFQGFMWSRHGAAANTDFRWFA